MGNEMKWLTASPGPGRPVAPARVVPYCAGCQFTSDALVTASGDLLKRAIWNKVYEQPHRSGSPRTRHAPRLDSRRTRPLRSSSEWLTLAGNARGREGLGAHGSSLIVVASVLRLVSSLHWVRMNILSRA